MTEQVKEAWGSGGPMINMSDAGAVGSQGNSLRGLVSLPVKHGAMEGAERALVESILAMHEPRSVLAIDPSKGFVTAARAQIDDPRLRFAVSDATALPWKSRTCDATVSGLVLNFVSDALAMVTEMVRVTRPGGALSPLPARTPEDLIPRSGADRARSSRHRHTNDLPRLR